MGLMAIEHIDLASDVQAAPDALGKVVVLWPDAGYVEGHCDGHVGCAGAGDVTLLSQPHLPHRTCAHRLSATCVLLDPTLLLTVAGVMPHHRPHIHFTSFRPVNGSSAERWKNTVRYIQDVVLTDADHVTPLVLGHVARMLAAVTLETFGHEIPVPTKSYDRTDNSTALLRRAIAFIDANPADDITLADIARAAHVSPRALQYMFRRHLDTTPVQYLQRIRLHHAHHDLVAGDRQHETVGAIAARWGFTHLGRFAVRYRATYGQSPHTTLRT
jgi:AraC-like DNA-binding protein